MHDCMPMRTYMDNYMRTDMYRKKYAHLENCMYRYTHMYMYISMNMHMNRRGDIHVHTRMQVYMWSVHIRDNMANAAFG